MELGRYRLYIQKKQYEQTINCINTHTALRCFLHDQNRFEKNIELLCGPKHFQSSQNVEIGVNPCRFVVVRNGNVIFHFQEGIESKPMLRSKNTGIQYTFRTSCFNELCWLPLDECPIRDVPKEVWHQISQYLSVEDKRTMRLVNKSIGAKFNGDSFWYNDANKLEQVIRVPLPFRNMVSLKQAIFRTLLYIGTEKQFVDAFTGNIAHLFAAGIGVKAYGLDSCNEKRHKRARTSVIVQTKCKNSNYKAEAKVAIGFYDIVEEVIVPIVWVTPRGKLRYLNNHRKTKDTWNNIQTYITRYRTKILSEMK